MIVGLIESDLEVITLSFMYNIGKQENTHDDGDEIPLWEDQTIGKKQSALLYSLYRDMEVELT